MGSDANPMTDQPAPDAGRGLGARLGRDLSAGGEVSGVGVVAAGSLFATESAGRILAGGGVAAVAVAATSVGARGIAASRVGMDRFGTEIVEQLRAAGVDVQAIQTDADLVTPRWIRRGNTVRLEPYAAFDNIQFDADLEALARSAEVIVTDACGRRHGQSRSSIDRMLIAAPTAARVIDLTRRPPTEPQRLDREHVGQAMELCDCLVVDGIALRTLVPTANDPVDGARRLFDALRKGVVAFIATTREEGCVVTSRGLERTPRLPPESTVGGTEVSLAVAFATVIGRPPHELVAGL